MKLAALQYCPPHGDTTTARDQLRLLLHRAHGADLIVCPEMAVSGYVFSSKEEIEDHVEAAQGPTFAMLSECAEELGATIVCGIAERSDDSVLFNSAITVSPSGDLIDCYRKILLFEQDESWAEAGSVRGLIDLPTLGRVCPAICMDINDDEFVMHLHQSNSEVLAFCTNWIDEGVDIIPYWRMRLCGWQGYMVVADRWGEEKGTRFYGRSSILGPRNSVLGTLPAQGDGVLIVDTETHSVEQR